MTRRLFLLPFIALASLTVVFAACNDDDDGGGSEEDIAEVEEIMTTLLETDPTDPEQVDFWLAHVTDDVLENFFGTTRKDCAAAPEDCIGEPTPVDRFEGTKIEDDVATTTTYGTDQSFHGRPYSGK